MRHARILDYRWLAFGDVDWARFGGEWTRHVGGPLWMVIRLDPCPDTRMWLADAVTVDVSKVDREVLVYASISPDGLDAYGDPIPAALYESWVALAYVEYHGVHGELGGDTFESAHPAKARASACRHLLGA